MPGTATTILIDGTPTNGADEWIDSLVGGGAWKDSDGGTVTIQWAAFQGTMDGQNSYGWTSLALTALREAMSLWESVANIDFVEVNGAANADVKFWWGTEAQAGGPEVLGWSDLVGFPDYYENPASETRDILFNAQDSSMAGALGKGSLGLVTMVHEIGHLLGLAHPHDGGAGDDATIFPGVSFDWSSYEYTSGNGGLNQGVYTTMSYNFGYPAAYAGHTDESFGLQYGPMALDIAAIQAIYGANTNYAAGNNVYKLPTASVLGSYFSSIWDTGGVDTISNEGGSYRSVIDLREATAGIHGGGYISFTTDQYGRVITGGYTIARGVVIENAIGGNGDDTITGNAAVNRLEGGAGDDVLDGGAGADTMIGGSGYDRYYVDDVGDVIVEAADAGRDTVYSTISFTLAATLEHLTLTGTANISGTGNGLENWLTGNAGDNTLIGGGGADIINGGDGNDRLVVSDFAFSSVDGGNGVDTLVLEGSGYSIFLPATTMTSKIRGIERFDLTGTGDNALWLDQATVLSRGAWVGGQRVVVVERDKGDVVQFADSGWTKSGTVTNADGTFDRWVLGNAEVQIEQVETVPPPASTILLSALDGVAGFRLSGVAEDDSSGYSVASAGDVNGDGFDDVIVGAIGAGTNRPGVTYVVFGKASGFTANIDLSSLNGSTGFKLNGVGAWDASGHSVASAGDVNGDGFADLIIGARWAEPHGSASGATYVVFGKASGFAADISLSTLNGSTGFKLSGAAANNYSGFSVASAGDFNGDGFDDLIIGARGAGSPTYAGISYIIYGKASGFAANLELSGVTAGTGLKLTGAAAWEQSGYSVASAGDVNGDGFDDVIVGAKTASPSGLAYAGASYVVFGRASGIASIDLSTLNGSTGFKLSGGTARDYSGRSVASAGDVNGDGFDDLIVGASEADPNGIASGASFVVFGKASGFAANLNLSTLNGSNGFKLSGAAARDYCGFSVATAGDVNGDGYADLIVGATGADASDPGSGVSYVVFGKASGFAANIDLSALNGSAGFALWGEAANDLAGRAVASAGDVNGDGYDDLIVGAPAADPHGASSGATYVVFGGAFGGSTTPVTTTGTVAAEILLGGRGNDVLTGGGGGDVFHAGAGNDRMTVKDLAFHRVDGGTGTDTLVLGGAGLSLDLANPLIAAKLEGIERIDLTGTGNNTLIVSQLAVLGGVGSVAGGKHILVVERNFGDTVQFAEPGWTKTGKVTNADGTFDRWVLGNAEVHVELDTGVSVIGTAGNDIISTTVSVAGQPLATPLDDFIDGRAGADSMAGGQGDDTYIVDNIGDQVIELAGGGTDLVRSSASTWTLGDNVENLILTGTASINGTGNGSNNILTGNTGNNVLDGGSGADAMAGGLGDDTYVVDDAGDVVTEGAGEGTDTVNAWLGWTLGANFEQLRLLGTADINGTGNGLNNALFGNAGKNVLDGAGGTDTMAGGAGDDTYVVDNAGDVVTELAGEGTDTVHASINWTLGAALERLTLTGVANINGTGNELANVLTGNAGNNALDGGLGADMMTGGAGDDTYVVDNAGDAVIELAGGGVDTLLASVNWTLGANLERLTLTGTANLNGTGNEFANVLTGNTGNNVLDGGSGADAMAGGLGDDTYVVDAAADLVTEGADQGTDTVNAWLGWMLGANLEQLKLMGTADLNGTGNGLANVLTGNAGKNVLDGGAGADTMAGGAGDDTYVVDNAGDVVSEGANQGTDTVEAWLDWTLGANLEQLKLMGTADLAGTGNNLKNVLTGNAGSNVLDGGAGADTMTGGLGDDSYVVDNAGDLVVEAAGGGTDEVQSAVSYALAANVERLKLLGIGNLNGTGNGLANVLTGTAGINRLDGGAGADTMAGGLGHDTYVVDDAGDLVVEVADGGADTVLSSISFALGANVERLTLIGMANIDGTGDGTANVLVGNTGNNRLDGGAGADTMTGGLGDDTFVVDNAGDLVVEAADGGIDTVLSSITHTLRANVEQLILTGNAAVNGTGNELDNLLTGNGADNILDGGAGADTMAGGDGNDAYVVSNAGDVAIELASGGTDTVRAYVSHRLAANVENLTFIGQADIDATGNELANALTGNAGHNILDGGLGADRLSGGGGGDTFRFSTALGPENVDRIVVFNKAGDTIQLDHAIFVALGTGALAAEAFNKGAVASQADDRILFDSASKSLYYDADGMGGADAVKFAAIDLVQGVIDHTDFLIV